ncbi:MAG: heavy metal-binding domain-containing protein [Bacteroidia bacterium]
MKKILPYIAVVIAMYVTSSCTQEKVYAAWGCPMQCQPDTVYTSAGKCPVCKMDLDGLETIDSVNTIILHNSK